MKALRQALEESKQKHAVSPEPMAEDNGSEKQEGAHSDLLSVSASSYSIGQSECIHLTPEWNTAASFTKSVEQASTMEPARTPKMFLSGHVEVEHAQGEGKHLGTPGNRCDFTDPPQQRPPFAGNCPPLTSRRLTIEKQRTGENWEGNGERGRDLGPAAEPKVSHIETFDNPVNR